jgi:hypothetical protein
MWLSSDRAQAAEWPVRLPELDAIDAIVNLHFQVLYIGNLVPEIRQQRYVK